MGNFSQQFMQLLSSLLGGTKTQQITQGQPAPSAQSQPARMQAAMNLAGGMLGGGGQSPPQAQTLSGGPTFAPDADGNLQIVPAGTQGAAAYMNQVNQPSPPPSQAAIQSMFQNPQFMNAISKALGGVYGGGSP